MKDSEIGYYIETPKTKNGKRELPFTTHGGSGFGSSISDIANVVKGATVNEDGLSIQDTNVDNCEGIVSDWLESLK